jgi:hypothetical protein
MSTTKRLLCIVVPLAVVIASFVVILRNFTPVILLIVLIVLFGIFTVSLATFAYLLAMLRAKEESISSANNALVIGFSLCSVGLAIPIAVGFHEYDLHLAKKYCEDLMPRLEEYRRQHGRYPEEITELGELDTPPSLVAGTKKLYRTHAMDYFFELNGPAMYCEYGYSKSSGEWKSLTR